MTRGEPNFADEIEPEDPTRLRLVAARSLLGDRRRGTRRALLIDSILAVLGQHGGRPEEYVRRTVEQLWGTTTVTRTVFDHAVKEAEDSGLLARQSTLDGSEKLVPTEVSATEVAGDREWVGRLIEDFEKATDLLLIGEPDEELLRRQSKDIAELVIAAVAHASTTGSAGTLADQPFLRPTRVDLASMQRYIDKLDQRSQGAVARLAEAALDESDPYGNEIVHLVVAGNVIHGVVTQRTGDARPRLDLTFLLLDASVLVDLVGVSDDPGRRLLLELIDASRRLGATVCVGEQTVAEWEGLWWGADQEVGTHTTGELRLPREAHRWVENPFLQRYVQHVEAGSHESWTQWSRRRLSLKQLLEELGVATLDVASLDLALQSRVRRRLDSVCERRRRSREPHALDADARTCAMVAALRAEGNTAYFVSADTLSPEAYRLENRGPAISDCRRATLDALRSEPPDRRSRQHHQGGRPRQSGIHPQRDVRHGVVLSARQRHRAS